MKNKMNINKIKLKAWNGIKDFINLNDSDFNQSAYSFEISSNLNLVIWCDIDYEYDVNNPRYFIVSIRYNPYDELFGDDISHLEYSTINLSKDSLNEAIEILTNSLEGKKIIKNKYGDYNLI